MSNRFTRRSLRPKKSVSYLESDHNKSNRSNESDTNFSSEDEYDPKKDDSSSGSELFSKAKKWKPSEFSNKSINLILSENGVDEEEENEYKLQRQKNVADRLRILKNMDFEDEVSELKTVVYSPNVAKKPKASPKSQVDIPSRKQPVRKSKLVTRRSLRSLNNSSDVNGYESESSQSLCKESEDIIEEEKVIEENLTLMNYEDEDFIQKLKDELKIPYDSICDFTTCDYNKFVETLESCHLFDEPVKVIDSRIVSMDFHPSEKKLLVLCGDKSGNVGMWDLSEKRGVKLQAHEYNVNCVSFSKLDNTKFYSTSLDGTTRQGDINKNSCSLLYAPAKEECENDFHTTWHHEFGNNLLISKGGKKRNCMIYCPESDGIVKLIDPRAPMKNHLSYKCHKKSVRTVQSHPTDDNYFLTSSGTGCFGIWDMRSKKGKDMNPVILEDLGKALTSAFYSCTGSFVLTTCNDDTIRIYNCRDNKSKMLVKIPHHNHTGRWLSVFKAKWQPQREDCFYVGSMLTNPKRIQVYNTNGEVIHDLKSPAMETYCPVITVHPTKPIIVGGNGSGKLHIFSPFKNLRDI